MTRGEVHDRDGTAETTHVSTDMGAALIPEGLMTSLRPAVRFGPQKISGGRVIHRSQLARALDQLTRHQTPCTPYDTLTLISSSC